MLNEVAPGVEAREQLHPGERRHTAPLAGNLHKGNLISEDGDAPLARTHAIGMYVPPSRLLHLGEGATRGRSLAPKPAT